MLDFIDSGEENEFKLHELPQNLRLLKYFGFSEDYKQIVQTRKVFLKYW